MAIEGFSPPPPYYQLLERGSARLGRVKNLFKYIKCEEKTRHTFKNWPLIKNPQFLSYPHETENYHLMR